MLLMIRTSYIISWLGSAAFEVKLMNLSECSSFDAFNLHMQQAILTGGEMKQVAATVATRRLALRLIRSTAQRCMS